MAYDGIRKVTGRVAGLLKPLFESARMTKDFYMAITKYLWYRRYGLKEDNLDRLQNKLKQMKHSHKKELGVLCIKNAWKWKHAPTDHQWSKK